MPGTYIFKPIEANLSHHTQILGKMSPYCTFLVGNEKVPGPVCNKGGRHPQWEENITLPLQDDQTIKVELFDKDKLTTDDAIGNCTINLKEIQEQGRVSKWYPLTYENNKPAGEILMETVFQPTIIPQGEQIKMTPQPIIETTQPIPITTQSIYTPRPGEPRENVFIEQRHVVEPHTFVKTVEVVEIRSVTKEIEVMEPRKIVKEVQYTEMVPVRKQIEVVEPQVVMKEIELIEPRLVTKQIQVIENVPVKKFVEIIEPRTIVKEIETLVPRTFTKQVEVTEQVPVMKEVTITEPIVITKPVDFVEPIITTKTIVKQLREPIIIDEKVTRSVGPPTVLGIEERAKIEKYREMRVSEQQRMQEEKRRIGPQRIQEEQRRIEQKVLQEQDLLRQGNVGPQMGEYISPNKEQMGEKGRGSEGYPSTYQSSQQRGSFGAQSGQFSSLYGSGEKEMISS